ncbi:MAG: hypothetical protein GX885_05750, partial [Methanomicrobiales archaeon]|nr:hypothetical protein [Methanomicrobiales archaeon]
MKRDMRRLLIAVGAVCVALILVLILVASGASGESSSEAVRTITDMDGRT